MNVWGRLGGKDHKCPPPPPLLWWLQKGLSFASPEGPGRPIPRSGPAETQRPGTAAVAVAEKVPGSRSYRPVVKASAVWRCRQEVPRHPQNGPKMVTAKLCNVGGRGEGGGVHVLQGMWDVMAEKQSLGWDVAFV